MYRIVKNEFYSIPVTFLYLGIFRLSYPGLSFPIELRVMLGHKRGKKMNDKKMDKKLTLKET
jgi:hypothetical protein